MLFCACSSVTIAIGIINAYMLVLCLYMCGYIIYASALPISCAGDRAVTVRKLSLLLCVLLLIVWYIGDDSAGLTFNKLQSVSRLSIDIYFPVRIFCNVD